MINLQRFYSTVGASTLALVTTLSPAQVTRSQPAAIRETIPLGIASPEPLAIQFAPPAALPPPPVVNDPGSGRSQGGASRGCGANLPEELPTLLVPLTPGGNQTLRWGLTTTDRPTFWLHIPKGIKDGALIVLTLQNGISKTSHRVQFQVPPNTPPAVLSLPIPAAAPSLQLDTVYRWEVRLFCNSGGSTAEPSIDIPIIFSGGIQRTTPSARLHRQLATAKTPLDRAVVYANNGIWYDSLTTLGLQQVKPSVDPAIARAWSDLLRQANLEPAISAPIAACCKPEE